MTEPTITVGRFNPMDERTGVPDESIVTFLRREVEMVGAGRTDAGVHASLMVAHFDNEEELDVMAVTEKLNRLLPPDISVFKSVR